MPSYVSLIVAVVLLTACGRETSKKIARLDDDFWGRQQRDSYSGEEGFAWVGEWSPSIGYWKDLPVVLHIDVRFNQEQRAGLLAAVQTWNDAAGVNLIVPVVSQRQYRFSDLYGSLNDQANTIIYSEDWAKSGKHGVVMGTTVWDYVPESTEILEESDVHLNTGQYRLGDALREWDDSPAPGKELPEIMDIESLALHEIGHLLGLSHVNPSTDGQSVMHPAIFVGEGLVKRRLSEGDIQRLRNNYRL